MRFFMNRVLQVYKNNFEYVYIFVFSLGLLGIVKSFSVIYGKVFLFEDLEVYSYLEMFIRPEKQYEIIQYLLSCIVLAAYYTIIYCNIAKVKKMFNRNNITGYNELVVSVFIIAVNIVILNNNYFRHYASEKLLLFLFIIVFWLFLFFVSGRWNVHFKFNESSTRWRFQCNFAYFKRFLLFFLILYYGYLLYPFVIGDIKISNEYIDIPEITLKSRNDKTDFSLYGKPITLPQVLVKQEEAFEDEKNSNIDDEVWKEFDYESWKGFIEKNKFEYHWQILNRWVMHHHNFILGPVNALALGAPVDKLFMQYGYFNCFAIKKILEYLGGIEYSRYIHVLFSFYYLYVAIFLLSVFYIFRRLDYVLVAAIMLVWWAHLINYQFIFLGPGGNPIRHFFDMLILASWWLYLKKGSQKHFIFSVVFAIVAIFNSREFGIFLVNAILVTEILRILFHSSSKLRKAINILKCLVLICMSLSVYKLTSTGVDLLSSYYLKGLLGFETKYLLLGIIVISTVYLGLVISKKWNLSTYFFVTTFLYFQQAFLYYVWGGVMDHFYILMPIVIITFLAMLNYFDSYINERGLNAKVSIVTMNVVLLILFCNMVIKAENYFSAKKNYEQVFIDHQTYKWNFEKAQFISTINPEYIEDSVNLIRKYSVSQNGIYILSKYDAMLPFIADKYSMLLPYLEVSQFLISDKEVNNIQNLLADVPMYIFVDSNMEQDLKKDVIFQDGKELSYLWQESEIRVRRLKFLQKMWEDIKYKYEPVESTFLLTVYKRSEKYNVE